MMTTTKTTTTAKNKNRNPTKFTLKFMTSARLKNSSYCTTMLNVKKKKKIIIDTDEYHFYYCVTICRLVRKYSSLLNGGDTPLHFPCEWYSRGGMVTRQPTHNRTEMIRNKLTHTHSRTWPNTTCACCIHCTQSQFRCHFNMPPIWTFFFIFGNSSSIFNVK